MSAGRPNVLLDLPRSRHMSAGMSAYAEEVAARLPRVAPDLNVVVRPRDRTLAPDEQLVLPFALRRAGARLVHFMSVYAPMFSPRPYAITIHDLIHLRYPEYFKRTVGPYYATVVRTVCARAECVITDDERTVEDLERFLGVPPQKVRVIPLGVDDAYIAGVDPEAAVRPYFLNVGNHREHKDIPTLLEAWQSLPQDVSADLYLTGTDDLPPSSARPERASGTLRFLGGLAPERLRALQAGALALVQPSLCEGFGLPLLEAASVGTPVLASNEAIPGVLRPYADAFAARDVRGLAILMENIWRNPERREQAQRFARTQTWDRCAEKTAEVYREILKEKTR